jgi:hypothetical protein
MLVDIFLFFIFLDQMVVDSFENDFMLYIVHFYLNVIYPVSMLEEDLQFSPKPHLLETTNMCRAIKIYNIIYNILKFE